MLDSIGGRIRDLRDRRGFLQGDLAKAVNVSRQVLSNWERGYTPIDAEGLTRLSNALAVSIEYILYGTEVASSPTQQIARALEGDDELMDFFSDLSKRDDLRLLFSQTKDLSSATIKRIIKYIKMVEDEEDK